MSISITAEKLFSWLRMPFTNTLVISFVVSLFLIISALIINRKLKADGVPGKMQSFLEMIIGGTFDFTKSSISDRQKAEKIFGIVATFFILILFNNWVELWPGLGYVGLKEGHSIIPIIRSPSADLNTTLALATISAFITQFFSITFIGVGEHITKYINFKSPIKFFVGILELISEISRILSFSFRLFGNIFAGEVLLILSCYFFPYLLPLPFLLMEVFVGLIQAFIFAMLTLSFIQISTIHE